jgi:hypothetical protein
MRLKSGLRVFWRTRTEIQVGADPRLRTVLRIEHPSEYKMMQLLEQDRSLPALRHCLATNGGRPARVDELVRALAQANAFGPGNDRPQSGIWRVDPRHRERLAPEAETRSLFDSSDGWDTLGRRSDQCVSVFGLGRTGAAIATGLATAGVGRLQLYDSGRVRPRDLGTVFNASDLGAQREQALGAAIERMGTPCVALSESRLEVPDAAVVVSHEVPDPHLSDELFAARVPHLLVVIGEAGITLGPWLGWRLESPCLRCVTLAKGDIDPRWHVVAAQQWAHSRVAIRGEDPVLAAMAAAHGLSEVLVGLGGARPSTVGRTLCVSAPAYELSETLWPRHPQCDRHESPGTEDGPGDGGPDDGGPGGGPDDGPNDTGPDGDCPALVDPDHTTAHGYGSTTEHPDGFKRFHLPQSPSKRRKARSRAQGRDPQAGQSAHCGMVTRCVHLNHGPSANAVLSPTAS